MVTINTKYLLLTGLSLLLLPLFMMLANPSSLPTVLLMLPALLVFVTWYLVTYVGLMLFKHSAAIKKRRVMAAATASLPTLLVVLQSLQQLVARDVLIVFSLWLLFMWYLQRIDFA